jgi:hypothetical protein
MADGCTCKVVVPLKIGQDLVTGLVEFLVPSGGLTSVGVLPSDVGLQDTLVGASLYLGCAMYLCCCKPPYYFDPS